MTSLYAASDGVYPRVVRRKAKQPSTVNPYVVWALVVWLVLGIFWTVNRCIHAAERGNPNSSPASVSAESASNL